MIVLGGFLIAILAAGLWMGFIAPAILRAGGLPMGSGYRGWNRRYEHLSKWQFVWGFGVFGWGIAMFLFVTLSDLFWNLAGDSLSGPTARRLVVRLIVFLVTGWVAGWFIAPKQNPSPSLQ